MFVHFLSFHACPIQRLVLAISPPLILGVLTRLHSVCTCTCTCGFFFNLYCSVLHWFVFLCVCNCFVVVAGLCGAYHFDSAPSTQPFFVPSLCICVCSGAGGSEPDASASNLPMTVQGSLGFVRYLFACAFCVINVFLCVSGKFGQALSFPGSSGNLVYLPADAWPAVRAVRVFCLYCVAACVLLFSVACPRCSSLSDSVCVMCFCFVHRYNHSLAWVLVCGLTFHR